MNQKTNDFHKVVELMKEKLEVPNKKKIQILTLTGCWPLQKTAKQFKFFKATAYKARILREEKLILTVPQHVISKKLCEKSVNCVLEFYQNDEYSLASSW